METAELVEQLGAYASCDVSAAYALLTIEDCGCAPKIEASSIRLPPGHRSACARVSIRGY